MSLFDFENHGKKFFVGAHAENRFCLLSLTGTALREAAAKFAFFLLDATELDNPDRVFTLGSEEIALINPNTGNLPIFRNRREAALTTAIYGRIPVLWDETKRDGNPWGIIVKRIFDSIDDSESFPYSCDPRGRRLETVRQRLYQ